MKALILIGALITGLVYAQCNTGCTTTIVADDATDRTIAAGQKLCIASGVLYTGLITVDGGTVENCGTYSAGEVVINSGAFYNRGIATTKITWGVGEFHNDGTTTLNGTSAIPAGCTFTNDGMAEFNGNLTIDAGATLVSTGGTVTTLSGHLHNHGAIDLLAGTIDVNGNITNEATATINLVAGTMLGNNLDNYGTITGDDCGSFSIAGQFKQIDGTLTGNIEVCAAPYQFIGGTVDIIVNTTCACIVFPLDFVHLRIVQQAHVQPVLSWTTRQEYALLHYTVAATGSPTPSGEYSTLSTVAALNGDENSYAVNLPATTVPLTLRLTVTEQDGSTRNLAHVVYAPWAAESFRIATAYSDGHLILQSNAPLTGTLRIADATGRLLAITPLQETVLARVPLQATTASGLLLLTVTDTNGRLIQQAKVPVPVSR